MKAYSRTVVESRDDEGESMPARDTITTPDAPTPLGGNQYPGMTLRMSLMAKVMNVWASALESQ